MDQNEDQKHHIDEHHSITEEMAREYWVHHDLAIQNLTNELSNEILLSKQKEHKSFPMKTSSLLLRDLLIQISVVCNEILLFQRRNSLSNPPHQRSIHFHFHNPDNKANIYSKTFANTPTHISLIAYAPSLFQSNVLT